MALSSTERSRIHRKRQAAASRERAARAPARASITPGTHSLGELPVSLGPSPHATARDLAGAAVSVGIATDFAQMAVREGLSPAEVLRRLAVQLGVHLTLTQGTEAT